MDPKSDVTETPEPNGTETPEPQGSADQSPNGDSPNQDWEARSRRWERDAKKAQARLTQLEQRVKTLVEPETVADKDRVLAEVQAELARTRTDVLRYRIAAEAGLPLDMAPRLLGDDEDALRADAKTLAQSIVPKPPKRTDAARGTTDDGAPARRDPNALLRQALGSA